ALPAADRDHPVDRLQARLHRFGDGLALDDSRRLELGGAGLLDRDVALAVQGTAQRIDDPAEHLLAHRDLEQGAGAPDGVALGDVLPLAEQDGADVVGLEVQGQAGDAVGKLEHLEGHAVLQAVQACDAAQDVRVHARGQRDLAPGALPDRPAEALGGLLVELDRARDLHRQQLVLLLPQALVLVADAEDHRHAVVFDEQGEEVQQDLISSLEHAAEGLLLLGGGEVGREEEHCQLAMLVQRIGELGELLAQLVELALLAGDLEQRACVDLGELLHQLCVASAEIAEKSSSLSASSTSLRWSASVSVLRVTFSVAMIVRSATSLRMSSRARLVAVSMSRSALRAASASISWPCSLASCSCDSAAWRARWTISSACARASFSRSRYSARI